MNYEEIAKTNGCKANCYVGRVIREESGAIPFFLKSAYWTYYLEVENKESGKTKRAKIGYKGLNKAGENQPSFFDTSVEFLGFTEQGLEAVVKKNPQKGISIFLIPRKKFPK